MRSKRPLSMISFEMNTTSRSTANRWSFKPRIITPSTKAAAGRVLDLELDAPGLAHDPQIEIAVFLENHPRIVDVAAGIEHGERALAEQGIQAALPGIEQFRDLLLRQVLQAPFGRDARIDHVRR